MLSSGQRPFSEVPVGIFIDHLDEGGRPVFPEKTPKQL
jgi:hypothetical protein